MLSTTHLFDAFPLLYVPPPPFCPRFDPHEHNRQSEHIHIIQLAHFVSTLSSPSFHFFAATKSKRLFSPLFFTPILILALTLAFTDLNHAAWKILLTNFVHHLCFHFPGEIYTASTLGKSRPLFFTLLDLGLSGHTPSGATAYSYIFLISLKSSTKKKEEKK